MSYQNIESDLIVDLSTVEQQLLTGGRCGKGSYYKKACYRPRSHCYNNPCGGYSKMDDYGTGSSPSSYGDGDSDYSGGYGGGCSEVYTASG